MIEDLFHRCAGRLFRCCLGSTDQLHGLGGSQFRSFVVDEAGNGISARQQFDATTQQHLKLAGNSTNRNQSRPTGVQPKSERGGCGHAWKSKRMAVVGARGPRSEETP